MKILPHQSNISSLPYTVGIVGLVSDEKDKNFWKNKRTTEKLFQLGRLG